MRALLASLLLLGELVVARPLPSQQASELQEATATCSFENDKQMSVQYLRSSASERLPVGKVWTPGNSSIFLYTQTDLSLANTPIPVGAYSLFIIPGKDNWTLVVNRNVTPGSKYDEKQDLVRAPMEIGQLSAAEKEFAVSFGRMAARQCSMRLYYGKTGAFVDFTEK